ncbi:MAG: hypothetical protein U1A26_02675 [Candidatus Sungbacteria bacterium]|nr:hypothetical protein [Candidatus Sungbacteria bacterium]
MTGASYRRYVLTIIVSALIVAGLVGMLWWLWRMIEVSRAMLEESQSRAAILKDQRSQARILAGLLKKRADDLERVRALLILYRDRPVAFVEAIEALAQRTGTFVKLTIDSNNQEAMILAFHAVITGSEASVRTMLRAVELMPYHVSIDELRFQGNREAIGGGGRIVRILNRGEGSDNSTMLTLTLRVRTL